MAEALTTIGDRLATLDEARFVGREAELARLTALLVDAPAHNVVLVHGPGGIGKSALLREMVRRAARARWATRVIEARDLPQQPGGLRVVLDDLRPAAQALVVFDSWEEAEPLTAVLRDVVLRDLPAGWVVVVSGRSEPAATWGQDGWEHVTTELRIGPLADADALACALAHGATDEQAADLVGWADGSPLAIVLATAAGLQVDRTGSIPAEVAAPLVRRLIVDWEEHLPVLACAAHARITTPALLADALPKVDASAAFAWLSQQPFIEAVGAGITLHASMADALRRVVADAHPDLDREVRRRIAIHVHAVALAQGAGLSLDLSVMLRNPTMRWGVGWDPTGRLVAEHARPGDVDAIEARLDAIDLTTWWPRTRRFFADAPDHVWVVHKRDEPVGFMIVAASTDDRPLPEDPVLGPWLAHARSRSADGASVIWRNARSLDDSEAVQALLGAAGLAFSGVANPRFLYLPIDPQHEPAMAFSASMGAVHVPELDVDLGEGVTECHVIDTGPGGTLGAQLSNVLAECGDDPMPAPRPAIEEHAVREVLRHWDRVEVLAESPLATGVTPADRAASVQDAMRAAAALAFGTGPRDALLLEVLTVGCLQRTQSHEQAAAALHLSRSAYFRHLRTATDRVVAHVIAAPPGGGMP